MLPSFKLSIIIPHLNEPGELAACLAALDAQRSDELRVEIIVVDNGSARMPDDVCDGFEDLCLVREPVPGPGPARNRGAQIARADLLAFIDADCVAQPGWIRAVVRGMQDHPEAGFAGGDIRISVADRERPTGIECYENVYAYNARAYVERYGFAATGNMVVRKRVFQDVGPFGGIATMEDTEWGMRASRLGYRGVFLPDAMVLTPSCKSFHELARRWDRHVAHEYGRVEHRRASSFLWVMRSAAIALSPPLESFRILRTDRLRGARNRFLAWVWLTRVRFYRAGKMLSVALAGDASRLVRNWNRGEP